MISRRGFLAGIIAAGVAPLVVKAGILMPIKPVLDVSRPSFTMGMGGLTSWDMGLNAVVFNDHWLQRADGGYILVVHPENEAYAREVYGDSVRMVESEHLRPFANG